MFINLVRIGLIRLFKGSRFIYGVLLALFFLLFIVFCLELMYLFEEEITVTLEGGGLQLAQYIGFNIGVEAGLLFCMYSTVCFVCDYYKYRQKINIEGMIRSRSKICLSEICALFIFSMFCGLLAPVTGMLGILVDGTEEILLFEYPVTFLEVTVAGGVMIFVMSLPVFFCAKLFRKKVITMAMYIVCYFVSVLAILFAMGYNTAFIEDAASGTYSAAAETNPAPDVIELVTVFLFPGNHLHSYATGTPSDVPLMIIFFALFVNITFWSVLSVLASRRDTQI